MERTATFGAGCFWGVEAAFRQVEGVTRTRAGYSGGTLTGRRTKTSATGQQAMRRLSR